MRRRDFIKDLLKSLAGLAAAVPLAALASPSESPPEITQEQALAVLGLEPVSSDGAPEPYPNPVRNAIVSRWIKDVDDTLVHLERFHGYLVDASRQSPEDTDGAEGYKLMYVAFDAMKDLCHAIEGNSSTLDPEGVLMALSGEPMAYIICREGLLRGVIHEPEDIQAQIDQVSERYPAEYGAELQRLYDVRFGKAATNEA